MRKPFLLGVGFAVMVVVGAPAPGETATNGGGLPKDEIEKVVAPIALYPDVLISQILPAATFPTDIVMASRWCKAHPDLTGLDEQKWDLSVISVCRYPEILEKLNEDLDWTNALGAAFLDQPADVMAAIQDLREQAKNAGVLTTTPQQTVVSEDEAIRIVPTQEEVVYVPQYDPQVIYAEDYDDYDDYDGGLAIAATATAGAVSFAAGAALGAWLDNDINWDEGAVVACRPGYWGGWGYRGAVAAWDNDWAAARGPRRGVIAGEEGGIYRGPHGGAIWGDDGHGAAWARSSARGTPAYTGRYSSYDRVAGNRRNVVAGNEINVNRNNVNIDRGDRTAIRGGERTSVAGGERTRVGTGDRTYVGGGGRAEAERRQGTGLAGHAERPRAADRERAAGGVSQPRPRPAAQPSAQRRPSSINDNRSAGEVRRSSSRGASSRGHAAGGGGRGGGRGGGGGRRGR